MLEILVLAALAVIAFWLTKAFFRVILYVVIYNFLSVLAYLTVGSLLNLDAPGIFLVSRVIFIAAALTIGNRIWDFAREHQIVNLIILVLFAWMIYRVVVEPPQEYYYHQQPGTNYLDYI